MSGRLLSAYGVNTLLEGVTLASSLSVSETTNKFPERLLFASISAVVFLVLEYFSYVEPLLIYVFPLTGRGTCTLVYLAPDISIAPNNQTLPVPLTHN